MTAKNNSNFVLNAVIGFLSLLLVFLLIALTTRIIYPRIQNQRSDNQKKLIGKVIQISVLNGCGVQGLANRFTNRLRQDGFDVVQSGNFNTFDVTHSMVIDRSGNMKNASKVAQALGIKAKNIIQETSSDYYLDATVVIGSDYEKLK
ncbi:MAG TPA: LytR C-terminal domain-containing protein [Balneolales bacterium]|nr:LytR C-terminal domain-containing protein [Balneolales bacterium]